MANIYVRSTDGSNSDNGSTWALAKATLAGAAAIDAAGDTIFVSQSHAETTGGTITLAGTLASPVRILGGNDAAEPPTSLSAAWSITTSGATGLSFDGSCYVYGLQAAIGSGLNSTTVNLATTGATERQVYDNCLFNIPATGGGARVVIGQANSISAVLVEWWNCQAKFGASGGRIEVCGNFVWRGGSIASGGTSPATLIAVGGTRVPHSVLIEGVDLSNASSSMNIFGADTVANHREIIRNCKLPASWSGNLLNGTLTAQGQRAEMWNCSASDTNYQMWVEDYCGSIKHDTGIYRSGGASDGDTPLSWKMASSANAEYPLLALRSPEIFVPNTTTGSSKTLTVEVAQDGTTTALNDDEIWLEVEYLGTSGFPLALFASDAKADVLASAAAQANSSETWTGLSGTNKKQALSVTFTPQEEGVYIVRVCLAKASTTVYVDPKVTVS